MDLRLWILFVWCLEFEAEGVEGVYSESENKFEKWGKK